jgi:DNA-binding Lrp family transcriptional regulator
MIDKRIIVELVYNSRLPYRVLAQHFGLTVKAVRKRVKKLREQGVIQRFVLGLHRTLCGFSEDTRQVVGQLWTNGTEDEEELIQQIGHHRSLFRVFKTTRKTYGFSGFVAGFQGLAELTEYLQGLPGVTRIEVDTLLFIFSPGYLPKLSQLKIPVACEFSPDQLNLIRCLRKNPRMSIAELARQTGQTVRRVRKTVNMFTETRCITFQARWDFSAAGQTDAYIRVHVDLNKISREEFANWLYDKYSLECWDAQYIIDRPDTILQFVSAHNIHIIDGIVSTLKSAAFVHNADALVLYRQYTFDGLVQSCIDELLASKTPQQRPKQPPPPPQTQKEL